MIFTLGNSCNLNWALWRDCIRLFNYLKWHAWDRDKDNKWEGSALIFNLRSGGGLVLSCTIITTDDEALGFTLATGYGIKLDLNESNEIISSIESSEWYGNSLIKGLFIWFKIIIIMFWIILLSIALINLIFSSSEF